MRVIPSALVQSRDPADIFLRKRKRNGAHGGDAAKKTEDGQQAANAVVSPGTSTLTSFVSTFASGSFVTSATVSSSSASTITQLSAPTTSPASSPPVFQFTNLNNATTCDDFTFTWNYTGSPVMSMTLFVDDSHEFGYPVNGTFTLTSFLAPPTATSSALRVFATDVPSDIQHYTWRTVDVQEGWYILNAQETEPTNDVSASPTAFFVQNGTNLECLIIPKGSVASGMSSRHLATADLIGIVFGALAAIAFLTIAFIFPRLWRRALPSPKTKRPYLLY